MDPYITAILGFAGQTQTNAANRMQADKQMLFQERMSSTAAQRAVEDYRKAGLNPALAYDRTASSPSGASVQMGDAMAAGIANAQRAREVNEAIATQRATQANLMANADKAAKEGAKAVVEANLLDQNLRFQQLVQPIDKAMRQANLRLTQLMIPEAEAGARWAIRAGELVPALNTARGVADIISRVSPVRAAKTIIQKAPAVINRINPPR